MTVSEFSFLAGAEALRRASGVDRALQELVTLQLVSRTRSDTGSTEKVEALSAVEVVVY